VLGLAFQGGGQGQYLVLPGIAQGDHLVDPEAALGEGSGLVEDDGVQVPGPFEGGPIPDEQVVETATTRGTASPRAWGQVMTITVTIRSREKAKSKPAASHTARVTAPTVRAT
jgi:hypothetical protein